MRTQFHTDHPASIIILGIDGATWRVMDPLMQKGLLPNIAGLIDEGVRATAQSLDPPATPLIWTSIATGKVPEKHGITNFYDTAADLKTKRIWDILSGYQPNAQIGLWAWPVTWPPAPLNGFVVPSFLARSPAAYPEHLSYINELEFAMRQRAKLKAKSGLGYLLKYLKNGVRLPTVLAIVEYVSKRILLSSLDRRYREHFIALRIHTDLYRHILQQNHLFFTVFYIHAVDACSHLYWKYLFPEDFGLDKQQAAHYRNVIPRAYQLADQAVGNILSYAGESATVVLVSDHGFQSYSDDPARMHYRLRTESLLDRLGLSQIVTYVNLGKICSTIRVKEAHAQQESEVVALFSNIYVPQFENPLFEVTCNNLGDIILRLNVYTRTPDSLVIQLPAEQCVFSDIFEVDEALRKSKSGVHAMDGVLVMRGPHIRRQVCLSDCSVLDVTPTMLALLGLPVGRDMDGRVLEEAIEPNWLEQHPPRFIDSHDADFVPQNAEVDRALPEVLEGRLRALGYID